MSNERERPEIDAFVRDPMGSPLQDFSRMTRYGLSLAVTTNLIRSVTLAFNLYVEHRSISDCGAMISPYRPSNACRNRRMFCAVQYLKRPSQFRIAVIRNDMRLCVKDFRKSSRARKKEDALDVWRHPASTDQPTSFLFGHTSSCALNSCRQ